MLWRRSYDTPAAADRRRTTSSPRRATRATPGSATAMPRTECLKDVVRADAALLGERDRAGPARRPTVVLVAAHGNSLRALVKHLDGISDDDIAGAQHPDRHARWSTSSTTTSRRSTPRWALPRPGGRRRGRRRRGRQPGSLTRPVDPLSARRRDCTRVGRSARSREVLGVLSSSWSTVSCVLAGHEVDDPPRDRDRVVGEPLVVAADQRQVDGVCGAARSVLVEQGGEQLPVQLVHLRRRPARARARPRRPARR